MSEKSMQSEVKRMLTGADGVVVEVLTFKEGLLAKMAHDLRLGVDDVRIHVDGGKVEAILLAESLRVLCARDGDRDELSTLSSGDKAKIEKSLRKDVLKTKRFPEIRFVGHVDLSAGLLIGELKLCGVGRRIEIPLEPSESEVRFRIKLDQRDFSIKPFSAAMGALKVKPDVVIQGSVPR